MNNFSLLWQPTFGMEGPQLKNHQNFTEAGTDINEVKDLNANSGLTYNEVLAEIARTGGKGTAIYSDTNAEDVRKANNRSAD